MALGGRTIAELKEAMTYAEFASWMAYRKLRGPLNPMLRQDYGFALIALMINQACGGKQKIEDYMLWNREPDASIEDVARLLGARMTKSHG